MAERCGDSRCRLCGGDKDIDLPARLVDDCHEGKLLLFVGAGASTEEHNVGGSFYERVRRAVGTSLQPPFPDLMSMYVEVNSRNDLIGEFLDQLLYKKSFPVLANRMTDFHTRMRMNPFLSEIITTNWDDLFETLTGAIPLVVGQDFAFWDAPVRKVLKIHGSILNPGSIVATREEYDASLNALRGGALGVTARHLIATRTVVFVGYSYQDDDIRAVIDVLRADLQSASRPCYFVHPDPNFAPPLEGARLLTTSARHFIKLLDDALVKQEVLLPRTLYDRCERLAQRESAARLRSYSIAVGEHPLELFDLAYRDGLRDCYGRLLAQEHTGNDRRHHSLTQRVAMYDKSLRAANKQRDYWHAAYIEGYLAGLVSLVATDLRIDEVPMYFCPGHGVDTSFRRISAAIKRGPTTHKAAYGWAFKRVSGVPKGMVFAHDPYLPY